MGSFVCSGKLEWPALGNTGYCCAVGLYAPDLCFGGSIITGVIGPFRFCFLPGRKIFISTHSALILRIAGRKCSGYGWLGCREGSSKDDSRV
jgi:hypothetical protein